MIRLAVQGAKGRMGSRLCALAGEDPRFQLVAVLDIGTPPVAALATRGAVDVVIDFSSDSGAQHAAALALEHRAALLTGSTGLSPKTLAALEEASRSIALLQAANTALGVAVLDHLAVAAARLLGPGFDIDIVETHHSAKADAPSGTALRLARSITEGAGASLGADRIHAIRAGDVIGEHVIMFCGRGERLTLSHSATSRDLFVLGALRAAAWLAGKPPGRYSINQALGLEEKPNSRTAKQPNIGPSR